jgi:carotenoid cleavage dioxygenase
MEEEVSHPFPLTPTFAGFDWPVRADADVFDLEIHGQWPKEMDGTFYRCGPEHQYPPFRGDDVFINGDGVVSMFRVKDGHVDFKTRFVHTERYKLQKAARRSLFGEYRNPYTDDPSVAGKDRGTANTHVVWHGGRLLALKEDSRPVEMNPDTLETVGTFDYGGKLTSRTMTAHPEIDPVTGELFFYGPEAKGETTKDLSFYIADKNGKITKEVWIEPPYASMMHDFAVTRKYVIFPVMPTTSDLERLKNGGVHFMWDDSLDTYLGVMPRDGGAKDIRWFSGPAQWMYHVMNSFDEGGRIHIDSCVSQIQSFPFFSDIRGKPYDPEKAKPQLTRWTIDLEDRSNTFKSTRLFDKQCEFPRCDDRYQMSPYKHGWLLFTDMSKNPDMTTRRNGGAFNCIGRLDMTTGKHVESWWVGERSAPMEPVFVPRHADAPEGDGWLMCVISRFGEMRSDLVVLDALNLAAGPIATAKLPLRARAAFHGSWVPAQDLLKRAPRN